MFLENVQKREINASLENEWPLKWHLLLCLGIGGGETAQPGTGGRGGG